MDPTPTRAPCGVAERISHFGLLDRPATFVQERSAWWRGGLAEVARGRPLGHALHPAVTDLPIGFWTSAVALDVVGGTRCAHAARRLVGLGVLSAAPTMVTGFADVPALEPRKRRVAVVHAVSNTAAVALFARSWWARARGRRRAGILDGLLAGAVATFGGYLGGWMAFGEPSATQTSRRTRSRPVSRVAATR